MAESIGVIFDCDGTLVDSMGAWHDVDRMLAAEAGIALTQADAEAITTMSLPEASAYLHEQCGLGNSSEEVLAMIFERMRAFYANEVEARPGALEFVRALHEQGVPMAVASSTPADMLAICVERCGFAPYMKAVVSVDDLQTSKREPAVYDHARSFLGTDRAHTWGFEDAAYALDTLRAAGYRTGAIYDNDISGTREALLARADFLISSWEDLPVADFLTKATE
ncbi:HAD family phosphatase [Adlercreutzia sp. R21]|uniref:HAD family hydrolase n=1 Tax=Adlercreutzia wanghongyangiae TaxID=3111451 RepID=UPI002DBB8698|nr:HAD family phosphatase [Adlercreutzia sp. R21]MEC4185147.1 HAD family phosphatase [Adlercreutzia sp. R21]